MSQQTLAEKAQVAQSTLSYIEAGKKSPTFETLSAIAGGLDLSIMDLLNFAINEDPNRANNTLKNDPGDVNALDDQDISNIMAISNLLFAEQKMRLAKAEAERKSK